MGYALASYSVIAGFILLLLISRLKPIVGSEAFKFRYLDVADHIDGTAPPLENLVREKSQWRRVVTGVLDFILRKESRDSNVEVEIGPGRANNERMGDCGLDGGT